MYDYPYGYPPGIVSRGGLVLDEGESHGRAGPVEKVRFGIIPDGDSLIIYDIYPGFLVSIREDGDMTVSDLAAFLENRAGDLLRGIARYDGDASDVLYLRDDVKKQRMRSEIDRILNRVRSESAPKEKRSFPFGDLHATVRAFEDATILHFPTGADRGIVVSLEPGAAQDLNTFVGKCINHIEQ